MCLLSLRYFEYVEYSEYKKKNNTLTPIVLDAGGPVGSDEILWLTTSTDHLGYHFNVGDMFTTTETPSFRPIITQIDGYEITFDLCIGDDMTVGGQHMKHLYSPSKVGWSKVGDFLFLSGATDVEDEDRLWPLAMMRMMTMMTMF